MLKQLCQNSFTQVTFTLNQDHGGGGGGHENSTRAEFLTNLLTNQEEFWHGPCVCHFHNFHIAISLAHYYWEKKVI